MKRLFLLTLIIYNTFHGLLAQGNLYDDFPQLRPFQGSSSTQSQNLNGPAGTNYQDIKRSMGFIIFDEAHYGQFVLINSAKNNTQGVFILADARVVPEGAEGDNLVAWATLNYEAPSSTATEELPNNFTDIFKIGLTIKYRFPVNDTDIDSRLANSNFVLLEITDDIETEKTKLLFNAYAAGFNIDPNLALDEPLARIYHETRDHKKLSNTFTATARSSIIRTISPNITNRNTRKINFPYNTPLPRSLVGTNTHNLIPVFNSKKQFIGNDLNTSAVPLTTAWHQILDHPTTLRQFLDPDNTYITSMPGGFAEHLLPPENGIDDLKLVLTNNRPLYRTYTTTPDSDGTELDSRAFRLYPLLFQWDSENNPTFQETTDNWLINNLGIKADNFVNSEVVLRMKYLTKGGGDTYAARLIYGGYIDGSDNDQNNENGFGLQPWDCSSQADLDKYGLCNRSRGVTGKSTDYRANYLNAFISEAKKLSRASDVVKHPKDITIPVTFELEKLGNGDDINVLAVGNPGVLPTNALQLFSPKRFANKFDYIKYREHRGLNSNNIYIKGFTIWQVNISESGTPSHEIDQMEVNTGNNGGYLNFVNNALLIQKSIQPSLPNSIGRYLRFAIRIYNPDHHEIEYGAWIDYFNTRDLNGVDANNNYNFVTGEPTSHIVENLKWLGPANARRPYFIEDNLFTTPIQIMFEARVPSMEEINLGMEEARFSRLRIAVRKKTDTDTPFNPYGTFEEGEVEDYILSIFLTPEGEKLLRKAKIRIKQQNRKKGRNRKRPGNKPQNPNASDYAASDLLLAPPGIQANQALADALAVGFTMPDLGLDPITWSFTLTPLKDLLSLVYQKFGSSNDDDDGSDYPGQNCGPNDPSNNPDFPYPSFDPDAAWQYWAEFNNLYNNIARIIHFLNNKRIDLDIIPGPLVPFISDIDHGDEIYWGLYDQFVAYYNRFAVLQNLVNSNANLYDLLSLIRNEAIPSTNEKTLLELVFEDSETLKLFEGFYDYFLKFQCFKDQATSLSDQFKRVINLTDNLSRIVVDLWGQVIPKELSTRICILTFENLERPSDPNTNNTLYHEKGDKNFIRVGIDSQGYLQFESEVKGESVVLFAENSVPEEGRVTVIVYFHEGKWTFNINNNDIQTANITPTKFGYENFTKLNNGARIGAPVTNFSDLSANAGWEAMDGEFIHYAFFDELLTDEEIGDVVSYLASDKDPVQLKVTNTGAKDQDYSEESSLEKRKVAPTASHQEPTFKIFPSPAKTELNILIEIQQAGQLSVNIFDLAGKQVYEMQESEISEGHQLITLRNLKLSAGQYIVKVKAGNVSQSEQVVFE